MLSFAVAIAAISFAPATTPARVEEAWLTQERAAEIRALVESILNDAAARASLLQDGVTAGWDGHPFIASADGDFRLEIEGRLQVRYVINVQDDHPGVDDRTRGGFETRRIRSIFSGHIFDPSIVYKVQGTFSRSDGTFRLEDAFLQKDFDNGVSLRAGQFRPPFSREAEVSTFRTTAVERAIAHGAIELSRSQGIELGWQNERISLRGSVHDGDGVANTPALLHDTEFALAARAELLIAGTWRQFRDFTGWPEDTFGLLLGGGVNYQRGEFGQPTHPPVDDFRWTVDASAEWPGAHLFAAVGGRTINPGLSSAESEILIAMIQGGIFLADDLETFARFEWGDDDSPEDLLIVTAGVTRYWDGHDLKWTTDVGYAIDAVSPTFASSGAGWREDPPGARGQFVLRTQIQLAF